VNASTGPTAGLFHHVIATNLVPIGTGAVGIGFHHLRATTTGVPIDTSGDGIPDWMEDVNGAEQDRRHGRGRDDVDPRRLQRMVDREEVRGENDERGCGFPVR
jgi:hypothetical protein